MKSRDEYARKQEFGGIVDPFAAGDVSQEKNRKEIEENYPDIRLRLQAQAEEQGLG